MTTYQCDNCEETATSLDNWYTVAVGIYYDEPNMPPPGGRTSLSAANPTLAFHSHECVSAWCGKAGVPVPDAPPSAET